MSETFAEGLAFFSQPAVLAVLLVMFLAFGALVFILRKKRGKRADKKLLVLAYAGFIISAVLLFALPVKIAFTYITELILRVVFSSVIHFITEFFRLLFMDILGLFS